MKRIVGGRIEPGQFFSTQVKDIRFSCTNHSASDLAISYTPTKTGIDIHIRKRKARLT